MVMNNSDDENRNSNEYNDNINFMMMIYFDVIYDHDYWYC